MRKSTLKKELIQEDIELHLIEAGKLTPQSLDEVMGEMKAKHGGKREGAGRKTDAKKTKLIRVTQDEKDFIQKVRKTKEDFTKHNLPFIIKMPTLNPEDGIVFVTL